MGIKKNLTKWLPRKKSFHTINNLSLNSFCKVFIDPEKAGMSEQGKKCIMQLYINIFQVNH